MCFEWRPGCGVFSFWCQLARIGVARDGMDITTEIGMGFGQEAIPIDMLDTCEGGWILGTISYVCLISVVLGEDAGRQRVAGRNSNVI